MWPMVRGARCELNHRPSELPSFSRAEAGAENPLPWLRVRQPRDSCLVLLSMQMACLAQQMLHDHVFLCRPCVKQSFLGTAVVAMPNLVAL